jgi:hypothetical protein
MSNELLVIGFDDTSTVFLARAALARQHEGFGMATEDAAMVLRTTVNQQPTKIMKTSHRTRFALAGAAILAMPLAALGQATQEGFPEPEPLQLTDLVGPDSNYLLAVEASGGEMSHDDLAKKLSNPLAAMISVPFQNNFDFNGGPNSDGTQWKMNVQPVIPVSINDCWNLIIRAVIPVISQDDIGGTKLNPSGSQSGLGDTLVSAWLSPVKPTAGGWIWGVGSATMIPTGTDSNNGLGGNSWGMGPTAVVLRLQGKFSYGAMVNHVWGVGGDNGRPDINNTFMQPFFNYIPGGGWTYALNTETSYNWTAEQWTVPVNLSVKKMFSMGTQMAQWELGGRYYLEKGPNGPDFGIRATLTLLFPK